MTRSEMADAVDARLRAFIDRTQVELATYGDRVRYLMPDLARFADDRGYVIDRAFIAARKYIEKGTQRRMRGMARNYARGMYGRTWMQESMARPMSALPDDEFGFVYTARVVGFPYLIKRGITTDLVRRQKDLSRQIGSAVEIEDCLPGTYFDEAMSFVRDRANHIVGEWFFDPSLPIGEMPEFFAHYGISDWQMAAARAKAHAHCGWSSGAVTSAIFAEITTPQIEAA
jgi:hypothetical protein